MDQFSQSFQSPHLSAAIDRRRNPNDNAQRPQNITLPSSNDDNPGQKGVQVSVPEAELIVKALTKRLEHHSKKEMSINDMQKADWHNRGMDLINQSDEALNAGNLPLMKTVLDQMRMDPKYKEYVEPTASLIAMYEQSHPDLNVSSMPGGPQVPSFVTPQGAIPNSSPYVDKNEVLKAKLGLL